MMMCSCTMFLIFLKLMSHRKAARGHRIIFGQRIGSLFFFFFFLRLNLSVFSLSKLNVVPAQGQVSSFNFCLYFLLLSWVSWEFNSVLMICGKQPWLRQNHECRKQNEITKELRHTWSMQSSTFHFCVLQKNNLKGQIWGFGENLGTWSTLTQLSQLVSQFCFDTSYTGQCVFQLYCLSFDDHDALLSILLTAAI